MKAARAPRTSRDAARLLIINSTDLTFSDAGVGDIPSVLLPGDLLIVNDAATLPASLPAHSPSKTPMEIRLAQQLDDGLWRAVLFGAGDWRTPTELRDPPEDLAPGAWIAIGPTFSAQIVDVSPESARLVTLRFDRRGSALWAGLYAYGRPIQYSYHLSDVPLWSVQTVYGSRPWSMEMPSAGYPFTWANLLALRRRGVKLAWLTHAAGLSAAGDEDLDGKLPITERYDIPQSTVEAVDETRRGGGRIVAVGTTVVRALEGCVRNNGGVLAGGAGETDLVIDKSYRLQVVDGILTGIHDPAQSHFRMLRAFVKETTLRRAWRHAAADYLCHEFGDLCLIVVARPAR